MAVIVFTGGALEGRRVELPATGLVLGRADGADLVLDDGEVSGRHAELRHTDGAWTLTDLGSSNGSWVNGAAVDSAALHDRDTVQVGQTAFRFEAEALPAAGAPPGPVQAAAKDGRPAAADEEDVALVRQMSERTQAIRREVGKVIVGQREVLDQMLMCMIARGHALLIGLPGMAKTLMVSTIARVLDLTFRRIQFTPDLMPTDITGTEILETRRETGEKSFRFVQGPIFCNLLLADEINRTPPKTQAALL
ncbi:MAG: AAA family ATPase, partial [Lentisphaerae bacterium]|nr:AAA family ATPase [Lentisphaerota bacterium]